MEKLFRVNDSESALCIKTHGMQREWTQLKKKSPCHFLSLQALYTSTAPFATMATVHMWLVKFQSITMKNSLP